MDTFPVFAMLYTTSCNKKDRFNKSIITNITFVKFSLEFGYLHVMCCSRNREGKYNLIKEHNKKQG